MATKDQSRQQSSYMPSQSGQQGGGRDEATNQGSDVQVQGGNRQRSLAPRQGTYLGSDYGSSPFALMRRLTDDMDRIFENFGLGGTFGGGGALGGAQER